MYETTLMSSHEWSLLVASPNTKRADGAYAYKVGATLDDNPHPFRSENYYLWKEGWVRGLSEDMTDRSRFARLRTAIRRRDLHGWLPEQEANG